MTNLMNIIVDGVAYGMILFMIAVGLSVTMGLMRVINLAHGGFALIGGAVMHWGLSDLGLPFGLAFVFAVGVTAVIALPLERVLYRRIYQFDDLQQVLATIGITFLMIASVNLWLGSSLLAIPLPDVFSGSVDLGFRTLPVHRILVIFAGLCILGFLFFLLERTRFGISLRAAVDNRGMAASLGINTSRIYAITFCLGAALAAIGGILGAELLPIDAYYPLRYMVLFLAVVAVGGMGSIMGSFLGALGLGIVDTGARYIIPEYGTIVFFTIIMVILALRPNGIMGRNTA